MDKFTNIFKAPVVGETYIFLIQYIASEEGEEVDLINQIETYHTLLIFTLSVAVVILMILRKIDISIAFGSGLAIFLTLNFYNDLNKLADVLLDSFNVSVAYTLVALIQAMFLADLYRETGVAEKMINGLSCLGRVFAGVATPALIGLLPMPGGAYVSAVLADPVYKDLRLNSEAKTYVNYWFRHIWIPIWPLYQNIIIASAILGLSVGDIIEINWKITLLSIIVGLVILFSVFKKSQGPIESESNRNCSVINIYHIWPLVLIALLTLVIRISLPLSLLITILLFYLLYRPSKEAIHRALKYSLNTSIIILIVEIFIYSSAIKYTDLANELNNFFAGNIAIGVFMIPFIIGFATSAEFAYVALSFPPFLDVFSRNPALLAIAFAGGYMGVMMSPSHACLILSVKYYKADLVKTYRYIIPSVITTSAIVAILYMLH